MKHYRQTTASTLQPIFAAIMLSGILSLGASQCFLSAASAESVQPQENASAQLKQKPDRARQLPNSVLNAIRRDIQRSTNRPGGQLRVVSFTQESWANSCLGLAKPNEACAEIFIENGWRVVMSDGRQNWIYRTDATGRTLRLESFENPVGKLPQSVASAVLRTASQRTGLPTSEIRIVKSEQIQTNGCLNLPRPGEGCTKINMPAWEVTLEAKEQRLVYRSDRNASQIRFNEAASTTINVNLPSSVKNAVLQKASEDWGLSANAFRIVKAEKANWAYGCESPNFPYPCDPIAVSGWQVTLESGQKRWVYNTDENGSQVQLYKRETQTSETNLPSDVANAVLQLASQHLSLPTSQILIARIQQQNWSDSCLGLPRPGERCKGSRTPGWRLTVETKPQQFQVYRTDNSGAQIRTEAIAGMPPRNDNLPNSIAKAVLQDASTRLKVPTAELRILQAQQQRWSNSCLDLRSPGAQCAQAIVVGWRVTVDGSGQTVVYRTNDSGSQIRIENKAR